MSLHQHDPNARPDADFITGEPALLVVGNKCRLLDGRRTPGYIQRVDVEQAMFTWYIEQFEDTGRTWELYAKDVTMFQFERDAKRLDEDTLSHLMERSTYYATPLVLAANEHDRETTKEQIRSLQEPVRRILEGVAGVEQSTSMDASDCQPYQERLTMWMTRQGFGDLEELIAEHMVLNPNAGELGKQIGIALAQLGLVPFEGTILRQPITSEERMGAYLVYRLAFVWTLFPKGLTVYRGMSSEQPFLEIKRSLMSWTDSLDVAQAFCQFDKERFPTVYLVKQHAPTDTILMSHVETQAFHGRYPEREVVLMTPRRLVL